MSATSIPLLNTTMIALQKRKQNRIVYPQAPAMFPIAVLLKQGYIESLKFETSPTSAGP